MSPVDLTFVIPTYRLRDVGETVEQYDQHFWRNGHAVRIVVFDDSSPANQEKYYPLLEQTHTHNDLFYVGPREKEPRDSFTFHAGTGTYVDETLAPLIASAGPLVEFVGEIGDRERDDLLGGATGLLFPIEWSEPFGLVMIEAFACGTPVIAWRRGSVPEVVDDGVTGYIVESLEEGARAVADLPRLNRAACRRAFEERFDAGRMARDYVDLYRRVIAAM